MSLSKLLEKIYPRPPIGGLEISDSVIRLAEFGKSNPDVQSYRLPPGIVENGRVKDKAGLVAVLRQLWGASRGREKLTLVLTLPSSNVFVQTVTLPLAALRNFEEAARLNVQMVSPLHPGEFYYDWQRVNRAEAERESIELLGAFIPREIIDDFSYCLHGAGFGLVAVEFTSLSLARELAWKKLIQLQKPYLVVKVDPEGTTFILLFGNQLLFHSSQGWGDNQNKGRIKVANFLANLSNEVNNISNFYLTHWGGAVNDLVFISSGLKKEIQEVFKGRSMILLDPQEIVPARGAVRRSILGDREINLLGTSSLEIFEKKRSLTFVSLWRTISISILGFFLISALGSDLFLRQLAKKEMQVNALTLNEPDHQELLKLKEEATRFNGLVNLIQGMRAEASQVGRVADVVTNLAGVETRITRLYIPSIDAPITVSGTATNEQAAVAFKNRLGSEMHFTDVNLPLASIFPETGGRVSFTVTFRVASLDFSVNHSQPETAREQEPGQATSSGQATKPNQIVKEGTKVQSETTLTQALSNVTESLKKSKPAVREPLVVFGKLDFKSTAEPITLEVSALDEGIAILFRDKLEESPNFYDVQIISGFTKMGDGKVQFLLKFRVSL